MPTKRRTFERHYPGDMIGIREWRLMQEMKDEEALADQVVLIEKINMDKPIRTEVYA